MTNKSNIRIIDIAKLAGVSTGTVDRVLHNRGRVSEDKKAKVEKVLKEINYQPNLVARFLASNRSYGFAVIIPAFSQGEYWHLVCEGISRAEAEMKKFNVSIEYFHFDQYDRNSFLKALRLSKEKFFDGIILAPLFSEYVIPLSRELDARNTPYIFIDSNISKQNNIAYFGGNSLDSGSIAAKLLLKEIDFDSDIIMARIGTKYDEDSLQIQSREKGFVDYLKKNYFKGSIWYFDLNPNRYTASKENLERLLSRCTNITGGIVLNSRVCELTGLLKEIRADLRQKMRIVGYDAIEANVEALKKGEVSFIISQRPELQGYDSVKAMGNYFLFKQIPQKENFMPVDILIKENIDYYNNYKL